ncbi:MAG: DNA-3-methyladenine glycosylase I [Phycisphaeraceae bacterium]
MPVCPWAISEPERTYHDREWGVPVHDDRVLFEFITLEGAQAGLSWSTILNKRAGYAQAFCGWDIEKIARLNKRSVDRLVGDASIVRHRGKIESTIGNAKAALSAIETHGSLDAYLWRFVNGTPTVNRFESMAEVPAKTAASDAMSKALKRDGFKFVGSTICYAFMQAVGMVNDHLVSCPRWRVLSEHEA